MGFGEGVGTKVGNCDGILIVGETKVGESRGDEVGNADVDNGGIDGLFVGSSLGSTEGEIVGISDGY